MRIIKNCIKKILQRYWNWRFSKIAVIGKNVTFGRYTSISLINGSKKGDIVIGDNARIFGRLICCGGKIIIETDVHIGPKTTIGARELVHIRELSMISTNVDIIDNNNHPVHPYDRRLMNLNGGNPALKTWKYSECAPIIIGVNTWIGKNSLILKGVVIADNSIVAANSVVTKDVPKNSIVAGSPAKIVKENILNTRSFFNE